MPALTRERRQSLKNDGKDSDLYRRFQIIESNTVFLESSVNDLITEIETLKAKIEVLEKK